MKTLKVFKYVGFGILGIGFMFLFIWLVMLLWNALIPELFSGPVISYWQTAGLFILAKILLSGFSPGSKKRTSDNQHWKSKYHSKYSSKDHASSEANVVVE